jgi:hypothetical protein
VSNSQFKRRVDEVAIALQIPKSRARRLVAHLLNGVPLSSQDEEFARTVGLNRLF